MAKVTIFCNICHLYHVIHSEIHSFVYKTAYIFKERKLCNEHAAKSMQSNAEQRWVIVPMSCRRSVANQANRDRDTFNTLSIIFAFSLSLYLSFFFSFSLLYLL